MSKNLTRKGLALGALVALGSSVIAGPAYAIDPVSLDPTTGTAYTTVAGETFNLVSRFTDAAQLGQESLKFLITDSGSKLTAVNGQSITLNASKQFITVDATDKTTPAAANNVTLTATSAGTVTVQAWLDFNDNGVINDGEASSAVRTVKFVAVADAGVTTTLDAIALGDTTVSGSIKFSSDINVNQLTPAKYTIAFGSLDASGTAGAAGNTPSNWANGSTDSGDTVDVDDATAATKLVASGPLTTAVAKIYVAQAVFHSTGSGAGVAVGSPAYYTVGAAQADAVTVPAITVSDNVKANSGSTGYDVRTGTKSVSFSAKVTKASEAVAGVVATVTVSIDTIDANDTITAGTASFAGVVAKKTFTVTSDAAGKYAFDLTSALGKKGTKATVSIKVPGVAQGNTVVVEWVDATISTISDVIVGTNAAYTIVKGGEVSIKYAVKDTFGALVTGKYRVASASGSITKQAELAGGYATIAFTDASTAAGSLTVASTVEVWDTDLNNWVGTKTGTLLTSATGTTDTVTVLAVAKTASKVSVNLGSNDSLDSADFITGNGAVDRLTAPSFSTYGTTISGDVTDLLGQTVPSAVVTISAPGVQFVSGSGASGYYSVGSITVVTNGSGHYGDIKAYSHIAGKTVFTVTTGSVTNADNSVTYDAAAADSGKSLVVTAPASAVPGKSVTVSAKLTDKWGNAVNTADGIAFTSTGAGYFVTKATETDATGVAEAVFVTQAGDAGTVKFTVAYTVPAADADDLTTSASTVFAAAVVVDPSASVATVTVTPASTTSQAGRALDVTVKAVDASGAAVAGAVVALSSTGAGSLSAASVVTGAAGTATVKLVAGASDLGAAVVTATSNAKSGSATVEFGATDASVDLIGKRVYVTTEFAAGKRVTIYDNGVRRYSAIQTTDAEKVVMWNVKAGSHTIVVKISGASSDSVTFLVK